MKDPSRTKPELIKEISLLKQGIKEPKKSGPDLKRVEQELRVHQVELEMQNEELRRTQEELEASWVRYFDLYDPAPVGYFTISVKGLILEANPTAAIMLGVTRGTMESQPLSTEPHIDYSDPSTRATASVRGPSLGMGSPLRSQRTLPTRNTPVHRNTLVPNMLCQVCP
jgi:PAS domain-containing protein